MDFLNASFRIGRLFDITIRVHILFLIWIGWRLIDAGDGVEAEAVFLAMLFGIVLVHEFGHCFGARSVGGDAENILLWPLGGLAFAHAPMTPWAQFVTVAAGPLVNVIFCLIAGGILVMSAGTLEVLSLDPFRSVDLRAFGGPVSSGMYYLAIFYHVNYFLLALNLLPIYPLDGGQLFQCLLWPFIGLHQAMKLACQVGIGGCIVFGVLGLTRSASGMLVFIALFGGLTCWQRLQQLRYGMVVDDRVAYAPIRRQEQHGFWARLFKLRPKRKSRVPDNPNPGGWEERMAEQRRREAEVDRVLKKVHDQGIQSLSYVERQTLERATRERQKREQSIDRQFRL